MRFLFLLLLCFALMTAAEADSFSQWKSLVRPDGLPLQKGPSGVPMGGIGCGYIELNPEGKLIRNCMNNIHEAYIQEPAGTFFAVREEIGGRSAAVRLQKDTDTLYGMKGTEEIDYSGMFPAAHCIYKASQLKTQISMSSYSFLVPHSIKDSSLPAVFYEFELKNTQKQPARLSLLFSFADVIGRGIKDTDRWAEDGFRMDGNSDFWHFMTPLATRISAMSCSGWNGCSVDAAAPIKPDKLTLQNYNTHYSLLAEGEGTYTAYAIADGKALDGFVRTGRLTPAQAPYVPEPANKPASAAAAAKTLTLKPGETKTVRFLLCWYADPIKGEALANAKHHAGMSYDKYYTNYFDDIKELCAYVIRERTRLLDETLAWQLPFLKSTLPGWLKFKIINSGYTVYTNGVLTSEGDYSSLEGGMGGLGGTMDQKLSSNPFVHKLLNVLDRHENQQFANYPEPGGEISHFDVHYYDGINTHIKHEDGGIGANSDMARAAGTQGSMVDNTGTWLLQLIKTYKQTGDKATIRKNYSRIKQAMAFMEARHNSLDFPDYNTTYDDYPLPKGFVYTALLYPVMLDAAAQAAELMNDAEAVAKYTSMKEKALEGADKLFTKGGYYAYGYDFAKNEPLERGIHTGALAGQFISRYLGQGDAVAFDKAKSSLMFTLATAIQNAPGYYSPKVYDIEDDRYMDMSGSACWPFYQDSYVAMTALQLGLTEDAMTLLEATQKVHADKGFLWTQSLWTPAFLTYMTAPVSWFITDVLAGASMDVNTHTITLGPVQQGDYVRIPLYYPDFWAELYVDYGKKAANLKITRSLAVHSFDKLRILPPGVPSEETKEIKLPGEFRTVKGAVLPLSDYFDLLSAGNYTPLSLKPVKEYSFFVQEPLPDGIGVKRELFDEGGISDTQLVKTIDESINAPKAVYTGFLKPRYGQEYTLYCTTDGSAELVIDGKEVIKAAADGKQTYEGKFVFEERRKYPFTLTLEKASSVRLEWWSTTNSREVVPEKRSYPPYEVGMPIKALDATEKSAGIQTEGDRLGFITNGGHILMPEITIPAGKYSLVIEACSNTAGGTITAKAGASVLGTTDIKGNKSWDNFVEYTMPFETEKDIKPVLRLEFSGGDGYLFNIRNIVFRKQE